MAFFIKLSIEELYKVMLNGNLMVTVFKYGQFPQKIDRILLKQEVKWIKNDCIRVLKTTNQHVLIFI